MLPALGGQECGLCLQRNLIEPCKYNQLWASIYTHAVHFASVDAEKIIACCGFALGKSALEKSILHFTAQRGYWISMGSSLGRHFSLESNKIL
jgi:hypothetical protein